MKSKSYELKIENPCDQNWNAMSKNDAGKYCHQCSKNVIDFTILSDKEIIKSLEQNSGNLCGRLSNKQQNRIISYEQPTTYSYFYKILTGFLLFGSSQNSFATDKKIELQKEIITINDSNKIQNNEEIKHKPFTDDKRKYLSGVVLDSDTKEPLYGVIIFIKELNIGAKTDFDGEFKLAIPDSISTKKMTISFDYIGYEKMNYSFEIKDLPIKKEFLMAEDSERFMLGFVIDTVHPQKKKWWKFWK